MAVVDIGKTAQSTPDPALEAAILRTSPEDHGSAHAARDLDADGRDDVLA